MSGVREQASDRCKLLNHARRLETPPTADLAHRGVPPVLDCLSCNTERLVVLKLLLSFKDHRDTEIIACLACVNEPTAGVSS